MHQFRAGVVWGFVLIACACGENRSALPADGEGAPIGTWILVGGSEMGMLDRDDARKEETLLVLSDSVYTMTYKRTDIQLTFFETGTVSYDPVDRRARFTVLSASGVDWSSGEPRKLVDVPVVVPFQRDPGTVYTMTWAFNDQVMQMAAPGYETTWFLPVRLDEKK